MQSHSPSSTNNFHVSDEAISLRYIQHGLYSGLGKPLFSIHQIPKLVCLNPNG